MISKIPIISRFTKAEIPLKDIDSNSWMSAFSKKPFRNKTSNEIFNLLIPEFFKVFGDWVIRTKTMQLAVFKNKLNSELEKFLNKHQPEWKGATPEVIREIYEYIYYCSFKNSIVSMVDSDSEDLVFINVGALIYQIMPLVPTKPSQSYETKVVEVE